jgi:hypothetical protein
VDRAAKEIDKMPEFIPTITPVLDLTGFKEMQNR